MGDGGVACAPSPAMDKFSICGGNTEVSTASKSIKRVKVIKVVKVVKVKKKMIVKKAKVSDAGKTIPTSVNNDHCEGTFNGDACNGDNAEEMEEGELGTLPAENGEFLLEKNTIHEVKSEIEQAESVSGKCRKSVDLDERDSRTSVDDMEKRESIPDRWFKSDSVNRIDEHGTLRARRYDNAKDEGCRSDRERRGIKDADRTSHSSCKYSCEKEMGRNQHEGKFSSRYQAEKTSRICSKVGEEYWMTNEQCDSKSRGREYFSGNHLKRNVDDSVSVNRKHHAESEEYSSSKTRRLSKDRSRSSFISDDHSGKPMGRLFKTGTAPSRNVQCDKYSSKYTEPDKDGHGKHTSSPCDPQRSPRDRAHFYDRGRSPTFYETSDQRHLCDRSGSQEHARRHDNRYRSPSYVERSYRDQGRNCNGRERTPTSSDWSPRFRGHYGDHLEVTRKSGSGEKYHTQGTNGTGGRCRGRELKTSRELQVNGSVDNISSCSSGPLFHENVTPVFDVVEYSQESGATEETAPMEVDMEICNTPPHIPAVRDTTSGKWYYLDHYGMECGPSNLCDLKTLMEEGFLVSDHLIKHSDSDRWVTVEKAVSPLVTGNALSVVSDTVSRLASPPEAPGNLLEDSGNIMSCEDEILASPDHGLSSIDHVSDIRPLEDFQIDDRVGALLGSANLISGKEVEMLEDLLSVIYEQRGWERAVNVEELLSNSQSKSDISFSAAMDNASPSGDTSQSLNGHWPCKGCDWKWNEEGNQELCFKKKLTLNDRYPLCETHKSGMEDPRWMQRDDLYFPSQSRRLDLPYWAFTCPDELFDPYNMNNSVQNRSVVGRGVKGLMLPVIRINACVVKDHGAFVSEPHGQVRSKGRFSLKLPRAVLTMDAQRSSIDGQVEVFHEKESADSQEKNICIDVEGDQLCKLDELKLQCGNWYYLDGAGQERGPFAFSELQKMAEDGAITKHTSAFRKSDNIWVPIFGLNESHETTKSEKKIISSTSFSGEGVVLSREQRTPDNFHVLYPQFIGYTRGKLHELVMKSYKSRELAAAINEVLDPWMSSRQPKKETEKYIHNLDWKTASVHGFGGDYDEDDFLSSHCNDLEFDELCAKAIFTADDEPYSDVKQESWAMLDGRLLARVLYFLRGDAKSLFYASLTCKCWQSVVTRYKRICKRVDFCSVATNCSDLLVRKIMNDYNKESVTCLVLLGCTAVSSDLVEELLQLFPNLSAVDIRGCSHLEDLAPKFSNISWVRSCSSHLKHRSFNHLSSNQTDDASGLRVYLESSDRRDSANQLFRQSLYKRSKLFDARKSSAILYRDAELRRLAIKKSGNAYRKFEKYIVASIRDIMRENSYEFFETKVSIIEERMKNGYYARRGIISVKDDISRMCRDAISIKNRIDARGMNRVVSLFLRLVTNLDRSSKLDYGRDFVKDFKGDSPSGFSSVASKSKKVMSKALERKQLYRTNANLPNGFFDSAEYSSDREIRRRLSKLNKKSLDSGSDTSDDFDKSSDASRFDSDSSVSETENDTEVPSEGIVGETRVEAFFASDDGLDSMSDEREWGARMTKTSLVPPVTRTYEVIDQYLIVADEDEVHRKMQVSLPEDYSEKVAAQRNGTEDSDMEIPEVKDYRPRKTLGYEVIEQEVYGIDPYTHNLLLDSMPEESDWPLVDKHLFIEEVLLRALNKTAREFTGSGNTPMMLPLRSVFEEILKFSNENNDLRVVHLCQFIMKAIDSRPDDNYVAYRKGLGVVCNKEGGFVEEDFIVEFLGEVYPTWKWFEKQDGIRALQKNYNDPAPEFYNIYLERPKGDADGYDLVVVDAMHKANYASRICHSCRPNCEAKVTAVDGHYQIGIYSVRPIAFGEEVTFDYNSVTESKEEYEASVCLCGNQVCRGSYLNLTGDEAFQKVLKEHHGLLDRYSLLLEACELNAVSEEDYIDLGKAGLGSCLLGGLPDWLIAYTARLVRFINFERTMLPSEILKHNIEEKKRYFSDINMEIENSDAEIQAEGVFNQRLQNLALTIDKVKYIMMCVFGDPKRAPPPLERLSAEAAASYLWKGEGSVLEELIQSIAPHIDDSALRDLKARISTQDPSNSHDPEAKLRKSFLWLRDEIRNLPCTAKSRHDAAADLIHIYAHTKFFLRIREYKPVTSPPVYITPLDLGPKYADKLGPGVHEYCKKYAETYCLGQLIFWHNQNAEPDVVLAKASRGCLSLPDIGSFYSKGPSHSRQLVYGHRTVKRMLDRMEKQPQRAWPKDRIWSFKSSPRVIGSPMLDSVVYKIPIGREVVQWLKHRTPIYQTMWDR